MSQEDTMRLIAEVVDKFSGPLKDLNKAMGTINAAGKRMNSENAKATHEHAKAYRELGDRIGKTKEMVSGVLTPALAALGITGFTAGEAISKLVGNLKDAADNYHKMNDAARRLGGSVDDVKEITNAYVSMGVAQEKATASAAAFGDHMRRLRGNNSEEREQWLSLGGSLDVLGNKLAKTKDNLEAMQVYRKFMADNPNIPPDQRAKLGSFLGMPEELANEKGAVMEEAANRADIRGNRSFADHSNLSYFQGYNRNISAKSRAMMEANFDKVFRQGSDISNGAIDNSSQGLAWVHEHGGVSGRYGHPGLRPGRFRTTANFGGDGITGHRGVESFEAPGWGESGAGERERYPAFRKNQLLEAAQRREQMNHTVKGDANLGITLNGFPKGTRTDLTYGGLFTSYELSRGQQMEASEQK